MENYLSEKTNIELEELGLEYNIVGNYDTYLRVVLYNHILRDKLTGTILERFKEKRDFEDFVRETADDKEEKIFIPTEKETNKILEINERLNKLLKKHSLLQHVERNIDEKLERLSIENLSVIDKKGFIVCKKFVGEWTKNIARNIPVACKVYENNEMQNEELSIDNVITTLPSQKDTTLEK